MVFTPLKVTERALIKLTWIRSGSKDGLIMMMMMMMMMMVMKAIMMMMKMMVIMMMILLQLHTHGTSAQTHISKK